MTDTTQKTQILLVDDTPANLQLLMGIFDSRYYEVRVATNGQRALATAKRSPPDLIMLDITMPDMDGYSVCRDLKADPITRNIPVIFVSALDEGMDKARAFEVGGADYVTKPFQFFEVIARLEHQLKLSKQRVELEHRVEEQQAQITALQSRVRELERRNIELVQNHQVIPSSAPPVHTDIPDIQIGDRYRLEEKVGSGAYSTIYRALHLGLNRYVAIRMLGSEDRPVTPEGLERFRSEGLKACQLDHPNAVYTLDFGIDSGTPFLATELLVGHSLDVEMREGVLPIERCAQILTPVCDLLAEAHAAHIVHGDLRPEIIFLHESTNGEIVKVLDFGLAMLVSPHASLGDDASDWMVSGKRCYAAPETLAEGRCDERSDVFSIGAIAYEMLSGSLPYDPYGAMLDTRPLRHVAPFLPDAVEASVMRTLNHNPAERPTAKDFGNSFVMAMLSTSRGQ